MVRVSSCSCPASALEERAWAGVVQLLRVMACGEAADLRGRRLFVRCRSTSGVAPVQLVGRSAVVVMPGWIRGVADGSVSPDRAAAGVLQGAAAHRIAGGPEDPGRWLVTLPCRLGARVLRCVVGRILGGPLCRGAWRLRWVVGGVCLVDGLERGHAWSGVVAGTAVIATYLAPAAQTEVARRAASRTASVGFTGHAAGHSLARSMTRRSEQVLGVGACPLPPQPRWSGVGASERPRLYLVRD